LLLAPQQKDDKAISKINPTTKILQATAAAAAGGDDVILLRQHHHICCWIWQQPIGPAGRGRRSRSI